MIMNPTYTFTFTLITQDNFASLQPLLLSWFNMPHVEQWWPVPKDNEAFFESFLKRIRSDARPYLVLCNSSPIGYIQTYTIDTATTHAWLPKLPGTLIGIDQFIGEPDYLHKGFGTLFIKEFIKQLENTDKNITVIVDPEPINLAAIRCYEKIGFKKIGEYQAPWGPALLMIYNKNN
ncbi:MAG: Aminoglycoside 6'-N-acetyltransferase type Ib-cr, AAC(6')-Ib-cr4 [candidate division TM6 bacterium GW2011_GWE2_41_16]|nr:MAG: Aminoglycoside 6'-N-acetyltransferase type Ib-cr, AAC(6')-Ib-cr4 [candidate division TM6 bacterium GW2011_GWE2_41_16]